MTGTKYKYALVDMSYVLMRNMFAVSRGKKIGEFNVGDIIRITIQTINKLPRDFGITADKFIFIYDKWDKDLGGYYRTSLLKGDYKSTREYVTQKTVDALRADPETEPSQLEDAELKLFTNKVRYEAKWGMIKDLGGFGLPCLGLDGWEYDDLVWLAACMLYGQDSGKPSVIVTKDSDLQYSLTPQMDYFKIPTGGSAPKTITYNEMYATIPEELRNMGLGLYQYKSFLDSLGEGHNDMTKTKRRGANTTKAIWKIMNGDYSDVSDREIFDRQMNSFELSHFPRLDQAQRIIHDQFGTVGQLGGVIDFHDFCDKYKVSGISDRYYSEFINRFDSKLFVER